MIKSKDIQRIIASNKDAQSASIDIVKYLEVLGKSNSVLGTVSKCNVLKDSPFDDWLKKQNLKEYVTKEYKWRDFIFDEQFVLKKYNEDKQT